MLQVEAVLPGIEAALVLIVPGDALAEIGQRPERRPGGGQDAVAVRVVEGIVRREEVVAGDIQRGAATEAVLAAGIEGGLAEAPAAAADYGIRPELVSEPDARLDLRPIGFIDASRLAADPGEHLGPHQFERTGRQVLLEDLYADVVGVGGAVQDICVGSLGGIAHRVDGGGIEDRGHAVEALGDGRFPVVAQPHVDGEPRSDAPIVLHVEGFEMLAPHGIGVPREGAAGGQAEKEGRCVGAHAGSAAVERVLAGPVAVVEGEDALRADALVGLLQDPVLGAGLPGHVTGDFGKRAGKGVIRSVYDAARLADADDTEEAFDAREGAARPAGW